MAQAYIQIMSYSTNSHARDTGKLIPGRFFAHLGKVYRLKKRTHGCEGCILNNMFTCPNSTVNGKKISCELDGVIIVEANRKN